MRPVLQLPGSLKRTLRPGMNPARAIIGLVFGLSCAHSPLTTAAQVQAAAVAPGADTAARPTPGRPVIVVVGSNNATQLMGVLMARVSLAEAGIDPVFTVALYPRHPRGWGSPRYLARPALWYGQRTATVIASRMDYPQRVPR